MYLSFVGDDRQRAQALRSLESPAQHRDRPPVGVLGSYKVNL